VNVLIVVATAAEAARLIDLPARVVVSGVGPVAAALATQGALLGGPRPELVISAGIGGAFVRLGEPHPGGLEPGTVAIASEMVYGDLGAWDGSRFLDLSHLGLSVLPEGSTNSGVNPGIFPAWAGAAALAARLGVACGSFVTVSSVTGTLDRANELLARFPGALIEGMEGAGVAQAASLLGVPCTEIRGVSNLVGPRDRAGWQIGAALEGLYTVLGELLRS
jgi:futalosine hydrolase